MLKPFLVQPLSILLFISGWIFSSCASESESGKELIQQNALLEKQIDSLTQQINSLQNEADQKTDSLSELEVRFLERKGLQNPVAEIKADLVKNNQLIPEKGTMGGTMQFYEDNIHILNCKWVRAYFEDGHTAGEMLLAFKVNKGGKIEWKVLDTEIK